MDHRHIACAAFFVAASAAPAFAEHDYGAATATALDREGVAVEAYVGVQRLRDSADAISGELAVRTGRFRFAAGVTRVAGDDRFSGAIARVEGGDGAMAHAPVTLSQLTFGMRADDGGPTHVLFEGGVARAVTHVDRSVDAAPIGGIAGVRLEQVLARRASTFVEASVMGFIDDVHATDLRVGARLGPVQASFRRLAFSIGPVLYGPELGLRF